MEVDSVLTVVIFLLAYVNKNAQRAAFDVLKEEGTLTEEQIKAVEKDYFID